MYKFFIHNKKFYDLNNLKNNGHLIIYNGYFPSVALESYAKYNNFENEIEFLKTDTEKIYTVNKKFLKKTNNIYFFYPFSYFDKNEYNIDLLENLQVLLSEKFQKEIIFILNNFFYKNTKNYKNFNGFQFDCYSDFEKKQYMTTNKNKNKIFISLNSKKRKHRDDFFNFLSENKLFDYFYYSYIENEIYLHEINSDKNFIDEYFINKKIHHSGHKAYKKILNDDLYTIDNRHFFENSYYYLITETNVENDVLFLSEKTYKAFYHKIPFIILGNPGSLKFLHSQGFETFSPYINEEYDSETNYEKRLKMIEMEVKRLISLNKQEHESIINALNERLKNNWYNYHNIYNDKFKESFLNLFKE